MVLIESVTSFRDLFVDPPEFDILQVSYRQRFNTLVRTVLGGLGIILLGKLSY